MTSRIWQFRSLQLGMAGLGTALLATSLLWASVAPTAVSPPGSPLSPPAEAKPEPDPEPDLVIHEWGTFLGMSGSDGSALDGMYHEEHALPAFVHTRSRDQLRLRSAILKGETPVIYFYTSRSQKLRVTVRFPRGVWTQWYPQANIAGPQFSQTGSPL